LTLLHNHVVFSALPFAMILIKSLGGLKVEDHQEDESIKDVRERGYTQASILIELVRWST
jgi:choline-glycine betaine transporter